MKHLNILTAVAGLVLLGACADFPEKYSNVIEDHKVRPFAVILDKPEAAPGDTVGVHLYYYDAGKNPSVTWKAALDYSVNNYEDIGQENEIRDLDSMSLSGGTPTRFSFIVPAGNENPILLSSMVPDQLEGVGSKADILAALDAAPNAPIPSAYAPYIDHLQAIMVLRATIRTGDMKLDVTKRLTVRYSNRVATGPGTNVNTNPALNRMGIAAVDKKDATVADDMAAIRNGPVQFFSTTANTVDTFIIRDDQTYFLVADTAGGAQWYQTPPSLDYPAGQAKLEDLFYDWFYTNLDETGAEWDDLIELGDGTAASSIQVIKLHPPEDTGMHNFKIRCVVRDYRPEYGVLAAQGINYTEGLGYFKYE